MQIAILLSARNIAFFTIVFLYIDRVLILDYRRIYLNIKVLKIFFRYSIAWTTFYDELCLFVFLLLLNLDLQNRDCQLNLQLIG